MMYLDLDELRAFLSDSAPEEIDLADPDQVEFEARRLLLLADTYRELARATPRQLASKAQIDALRAMGYKFEPAMAGGEARQTDR